MVDAQAFLTALWGLEPPGLIQLWEIATKASAYVEAPSVIGSTLDGASDVYTCVATVPETPDCPPTCRHHPCGGRFHRGAAAGVNAIAGLWLDIDIDTPERKSDGVPDRDAAMDLAHAVAPPTLVVDSGYGVHAWHLFEEPWAFDSGIARERAAMMARQWYERHRRYCQLWGWYLGGTSDLARLLRLPGTVNGKIPHDPLPVTVVAPVGPRYTIRELSRRCAVVGQIAPPLTDLIDVGDIDFHDLPSWVGEMCERHRGIGAAFVHRPTRDDWSASEWDLALISRALENLPDLSDEQLATLMLAHRRAHGADERKVLTGKYAGKTIARARSTTT